MATAPLIIGDWDKGIADSPHKGHGLLRNADIESFSGAVKSSLKPQSYFSTTVNTVTFTADAATDVCTVTTGTVGTTGSGVAIYFTTTGTLPAGLSTGTVYFLIGVSTTTFKVATSYKNSVGTAAGTQIDITDAGTGTHTLNPVAIGTIKHIVEDPRSGTYKYLLDSNGRVWFVPSGSTAYLLHNSAIESPAGALTNAAGNGLVIHNFSSTTATYLFVFRNAVIDVIDVFGNTQIEALNWSNSWQTLNSGAGSGNSHHAIIGQDNIIYFCDDRYVGSIKENSGSTFDPATGATFTYNNQALDLPSREVAQYLAELGTNLMIAGNTFNKIYPWDRTSDSFSLPIEVPEYSVKLIKAQNGELYIFPGTWGNIYKTQGTYVQHVRKLPFYVVNNAFSIVSNPITWGGVSSVNGNIIFGISGTTSNSSGLYKLYPDGRLVHVNTPASGSTNVTAIFAKDEFYVMGYAGGADNFNNAAQYSSFETVLHSPLYKVATYTEKATFSTLEVVTAKVPTSGQGRARISYRTDTLSSFTTIDTFTFNSSSDNIQKNDAIGLIDIDNIQIQVELDGNIELIEVRLLP